MADIVSRLRLPSDNEDTMKVWDTIRSIIADGNRGSWPRDVLESILSHIDEEREEAADEIERLRKALEPFVKDIENWTDENGWTNEAPSGDRIRDWFGPSDFRAARAALEDKRGGGE